MRNVINTLIRDLYRKIPEEILREAFFVELKTGRTLDSIIREKIIIAIVLNKCNLYAGKMAMIPLQLDYAKSTMEDSIGITSLSGNFGVYVIPPEARENRPIVAILETSYPTTMGLYGTYPNIGTTGRSVASGIDQMLSSFTREPLMITPTAVLLDGDSGVIQLSPPGGVHVDWILSCMLAFDNEFSNIALNLIKPLNDMVEYAAKAYIYNKLIIRINQGYLQGGLQLESIRSIIESYADAEERFSESLMKMRGASMFSPETFRGFLSLMIGD